MSDYNPTYTVRWHDYKVARKEREKALRRQKRAHKGSAPLTKALERTPAWKFAPLITEERPNPLSMELRIVLHYFWTVYNQCIGYADGPYQNEKEYRAEATAAFEDARNICYELFAVTSPHAPLHNHSEYGCNDEDCPAWKRGYEAAQENVLDWYEPNS